MFSSGSSSIKLTAVSWSSLPQPRLRQGLGKRLFPSPDSVRGWGRDVQTWVWRGAAFRSDLWRPLTRTHAREQTRCRLELMD